MDENLPLVYEAGLLEADPSDGRLRCHLCGKSFKNLARHVLGTHRLSADEYRLAAGLNRGTRLLSEGLREWLRQADKPLIERMRAEGKMRRFNEDPEKHASALALARAASEDGLSPEARRHRREGWTEERRATRANLTRQQNLSRAEEGRDIICSRCGASFKANNTTGWYCQPCREEHYREYDREFHQRTRGRDVVPGPRQVSCARCGHAFTAKSPLAKYCSPCRPAADRERHRERERRIREGRQTGTCQPE